MARITSLVLAATMSLAAGKLSSFRNLPMPNHEPAGWGRALDADNATTTMFPGMPTSSETETQIVLSFAQTAAPSWFSIYTTLGPAIGSESATVDYCDVVGGTVCLKASYTVGAGGANSTSWSVTCETDTACSCGDQATLCSAPAWSMQYCVPNFVTTCPASCSKDPTQTCVSMSYRFDGTPTGMPANITCNDQCTCNPTWENKCTYQGMSWCVPKSSGQCPLDCGSGTMCSSMQSFANGTVITDSSGDPTYNFTCAVNGICSCNPALENSCTNGGNPYCIAKPGTCPLDCGANPICYSWNWTQSCPTAAGCTCDPAYELACQDGNNMTQCLDKTYYTTCPTVCAAGSSACTNFGFNADGSYSATQVCTAVADPSSCPTLCDSATADVCGDPTTPWSYCMPKGTCPPQAPTCAADQQLCYGQNASTAGTLQDVGTCLDASAPCPCGAGQQTCVDSTGYSFCTDASFGCPINCGDPTVNQTCTVTGFNADGSLDFDSLYNQTCAAINATCPCGSNALSCTYMDMFGTSNSYCQPAVVDGIATQCPLTCNSTSQLCIVPDYDSFGNYTGYSQSCAPLSASCGCGKNTTKCIDEFGGGYCLPGKQTCPKTCNAVTENTCNIPTYDAQGNVVSVNTDCVPSGQQCPCPSLMKGQQTNAVPCNFTGSDGSVFTDCIPKAYFSSWCPPQCPADKPVACPAPHLFSLNGSFVGMGDSYCAATQAACGCGGIKSNAQECTINGQTFCYPTAVQCPLDCPDGQQLCYVTNYDDKGTVTSESQKCVGVNATCPCGTNAVLPAGSSACVSSLQNATLSPCGSDKSKDVCWVEDFTKNGVSVGKNPVCVVKGDTCPCGKNAKSCPDPTDATQNLCVPQSSRDGSSACPAPCTPAQEQANRTTCVQTNLDTSGNFVSQSVTCVAVGSCEPGQNQKLCPSGAMVFTGSPCQDIYGVVGSNNSLGTPAGQSQEGTLVMSLDPAPGVNASALAAMANNVQANLATVMQLPADLACDVSFVAVAANGRRLQAGQPGQPKRVQAVVTVKSTGKSKVAPSVVVTKAKSMAGSGTASFNKAFGQVGQPNAKLGVSAASATKPVVARATVAAAATAKATNAGTGGTTTAAARGTTAATATTVPVTPAPQAGKGSASSGNRLQPTAVLFGFSIIALTAGYVQF